MAQVPAPRRSLLGRARYRAGQFFGGFRATLTPDELAFVRGVLTRGELALFAGMQARDQRHSLRVAAALRDEGDAQAPPDLLAAALLHDVGKGDLLVTERVVYVLLAAVSSRLVDLVGSPRPRWRNGIWRLRHHARLGAERLSEEGSSRRVIDLVAAHVDGDPAGDDELARLQAVDHRY